MDARFKLVPGISHNLQVTSSKESDDVKGTGEKIVQYAFAGCGRSSIVLDHKLIVINCRWKEWYSTVYIPN